MPGEKSEINLRKNCFLNDMLGIFLLQKRIFFVIIGLKEEFNTCFLQGFLYI